MSFSLHRVTSTVEFGVSQCRLGVHLGSNREGYDTLEPNDLVSEEQTFPPVTFLKYSSICIPRIPLVNRTKRSLVPHRTLRLTFHEFDLTGSVSPGRPVRYLYFSDRVCLYGKPTIQISLDTDLSR